MLNAAKIAVVSKMYGKYETIEEQIGLKEKQNENNEIWTAAAVRKKIINNKK